MGKTLTALAYAFLLLALGLPAGLVPARAQGEVEARVVPYQLNVRETPGPDAALVGQFMGGTTVRVTGREDNPHDTGVWVFAVSPDGALSGWALSDYLRFPPDFDVLALPVIEAAGAAVPAADAPAPENPPAEPPDAAAPPPAGIPDGVVPPIGPRAREIFLAGQARGNRAGVFSVVGDSITDSPLFLKQIGWGQAQLGDYGALAPVIDHFSTAVARDGNSFVNTSLAARGEWTSFNPLDPASVYAPGLCRRDESPLACEYRVVRPAVALIMIGTNDIYFGLDSASYRANLEAIAQTSIDMGVIPVLSTIPDNLQNPDQAARVPEFNDIVRDVAAAFGVPLWDYWRALQDLPNRGISFDGLHPSFDAAPGTAVIFTPDYLQYGFNMRNLTALLALDAVWRGALY